MARFGEDGRFQMRNEVLGQGISGRYAIEAGTMTLSEPEGDLQQGVSFPLRCAVASEGDGFVLSEPGGDGAVCGPLAGVAFEVAR